MMLLQTHQSTLIKEDTDFPENKLLKFSNTLKSRKTEFIFTVRVTLSTGSNVVLLKEIAWSITWNLFKNSDGYSVSSEEQRERTTKVRISCCLKIKGLSVAFV